MCREWEATARQVNQGDVRLVLLRIGVVLGKDGGALGWCVSLHSFGHFFVLQRPFPFVSHYSPDSFVHNPFAAKMIPLFMMFAGGPLGTGRQWLLLFLDLPFYIVKLGSC